MKIYAALFFILLGAVGTKTVEEVIAPRIAYGYNKVDDERMEMCRMQSQRLLRRLTFQVTNTYNRCMAKEIYWP